MADPRFRICVIDDDREMRQSLAHLLDRANFEVSPYADARVALREIEQMDFDIVLSDVRMPGMSGLELLKELSQRNFAPPLVLISAHGDIPTAVDAMQGGAYSFLEKPFDPRRLITILEHAAEAHQLRRTTSRMRDEISALSGLDRVLIGEDARLVALRSSIHDLAAIDGSVLITGDTGTGKEVVARALHNIGPHRDAPFVPINCALIPPERFEELVFGVESGARGLMRTASGGTLFLDEVSACPEPVQTKLLRVIEQGESLPVGSDDIVPVSVRVIAASNENLEDKIAEGRFRSDLFFRLAKFRLHLPRLTDRGEDVIRLFEHFCDQLAQTYEITPPDLSAEDAAALLSHNWPGNVRELRNVAERRILAARRGVGSVAEAMTLGEETDTVPATLREAISAFERTLIGNALRAHSGRMDAVAEALGIGRRTLNEKIVKLGLDKADFTG